MGVGLGVVLGLVDVLPLALAIAVWIALWALYLSIVNVGQTFYSFGWETLLCEAGFLMIFFGPAWTVTPPPLVYLVRSLVFPLQLGAGLLQMPRHPWRPHPHRPYYPHH